MSFKEFLDQNTWIVNLAYSLLIIVIAILIYSLLQLLIFKRIEDKSKKVFSGKKSNTYFKLFKSLNRYLYALIVIFIVLKINGVNISSMLAGVGILGILFGLAIQDAVKDIIRGIDIVADSYYQVGDIIRVGEYTGRVLAIGIKTTQIEDIYEFNKVSIANRNIEKVEILSHMINIDIPLPYELEYKKAEDLIEYISKEIMNNKKVEKVEYRGVNELAESSIKYHIKVYSAPIDKIQVRRDALTCIVKCLEEKNIHVPYNQLDIHQK